jgi:hypothetical protein
MFTEKNSLLKLAVIAGLPVVSVTSKDVLRLAPLLEAAIGQVVIRWTGKQSLALSKKVLWSSDDTVIVSPELFMEIAHSGKTLILINQQVPCPVAFKAGELYPADTELAGLLSPRTKEVKKFLPLLAGLGYQQSMEVIRIAEAAHGKLTISGVTEVRRFLLGSQAGLTQVPVNAGFYEPAPAIKTQVAEVKTLLNNPSVPSVLAPRGVLLAGPPGTGKTQAAAYFAKEIGLPLYRLNLASTLSEYVGVSERNLERILAGLEKESPCVFLLDEIEKLFTVSSKDEGVTERMLSQLLWWLQERTSPVFTVMTTNDIHKLPKELYRPGRIDSVHVFTALSATEARNIAFGFANSLGIAGFLEKLPALLPDIESATTAAEVVAKITCFAKQHFK